MNQAPLDPEPAKPDAAAVQQGLPAAGAVPSLDDMLADRENADFKRSQILKHEHEFYLSRGHALRSLARLCEHLDTLSDEQLKAAGGHATEMPAVQLVRGELVNRFQGSVVQMLARHPELPDFQEQWTKCPAYASRPSSGSCLDDPATRALVTGLTMSDPISSSIRDFLLAATDAYAAATKGDFVETARASERCKAAAVAITVAG